MSALLSAPLLAVVIHKIDVVTLLSYGVILIVLAYMPLFIVNRLVTRIEVPSHNVGLLYCNGRLVRKLESGRYWFWRPFMVWTLSLYETRAQFFNVPVRDLDTSDNVAIKVKTAISYDIADPELVENSVVNYHETLLWSVEMALRDAVGKRAIGEILEKRDEISAEIRERVVSEMEPIGLRVRRAEIRDIEFPRDLKRTCLDVVKARKQAEVVLERTRGETAALRELASVSDVLKDNPELMNLQLLKVISRSSGNKYVVEFPQGFSQPGTMRASKDCTDSEK